MAAAAEVHGQERVPADEGQRGGRAAGETGGQYGARDYGRGGKGLEDPGGRVLGLAGGTGDRLRREGESRPVDRRRVAPVCPDPRQRRVVRELLRRIAVGVTVEHGGDPAVAPVSPRVGGEEQRSRHRGNLDGDGEREDHSHASGGRAAQEREASGIHDESGRHTSEEQPRQVSIARRASSGLRRERRLVGPCQCGARRDEEQRAGPAREPRRARTRQRTRRRHRARPGSRRCRPTRRRRSRRHSTRTCTTRCRRTCRPDTRSAPGSRARVDRDGRTT